MATTLKPLPRSKAKTAYGLLGDVMRAMLEEPKRVDMSVFVDEASPNKGGPACGTVGCFAGWVSLLKGGVPQDERNRLGPWAHKFHAQRLLGVCDYYTAGTNDGYVFSAGNERDGYDDDIKGDIGTMQYARSVVARIKKFRKVNEKALRAKKV